MKILISCDVIGMIHEKMDYVKSKLKIVVVIV